MKAALILGIPTVGAALIAWGGELFLHATSIPLSAVPWLVAGGVSTSAYVFANEFRLRELKREKADRAEVEVLEERVTGMVSTFEQQAPMYAKSAEQTGEMHKRSSRIDRHAELASDMAQAARDEATAANQSTVRIERQLGELLAALAAKDKGGQ